MALTWADFNNGESALSIRTKINAFNNSAVTEVGTISAAVNTNIANIATNTAAIGTNTANIATNTSDIADIDTRTTAIETKLADYNVFGTLYGVYSSPKAYNLTTTYQDLANFASSGSHLITASTTNGTFIPTHTAFYKVSLFITGTTSESSQKIATIALVEDGVVLMEGSSPYISATGINIAFSGVFPFTAGKEYKIQIKGGTAGTVNITADNFAVHHVGD